MKYYTLLLFIAFSLISKAQNVVNNGSIYKVKNEKIYLDNKDVTETLSADEKTIILKEAALIREKKALDKEKKKQDKANKKAERAKKQAEKKQKKN